MRTALGGLLKIGYTHGSLREVELRPGTFSFGFTRNPWNRMASMYWSLAWHRTGKDWYDRDACRAMGFKRWLLEEQWWLNPAEREIGAPPLQRRPSMWHLEGCSFIGKYECLEQNFQKACELGRIRLRNSLFYQPSNVLKPPTVPYSRMYDDEMRVAIADWHRADVEPWDYEFGIALRR